MKNGIVSERCQSSDWRTLTFFIHVPFANVCLLVPTTGGGVLLH
jgi:hypothetical protein